MTDDITQAERDEAARVNELRRHAGLFELTIGEVAAMRRIREAESTAREGYPPEHGPWSAEATAEDAWETYRELHGPDIHPDDPAATTQDPDVMPASVHGETVVSAFRHLPLYGVTADTYTVVTLDTASSPESARRYSVFRTRFAPALGRWSIDTGHEVRGGLSWAYAAEVFTRLVASRVS